MKNRLLRKFMIVFILSILGMALLSLTGKRPTNIGVRGGSLAPVPDSPNAVATFAEKESQKMQPIKMSRMSDGQMIEQIREVIESMPRSKVIKANDNYLYAEFRSLIFRFTDDVEFLVDETEGLVHFRSASRVGHSDLGKNRSRMEAIVTQLSGQQ